MNVEFVEELKKQWMAMIDSINDPLVIVDQEFRIIRQNAAYARLAQNAKALSIREFRGECCFQVFANRSAPCEDCRLQESLVSSKEMQWVTQHLLSEHDIEVRVHPMAVNKQGQRQFVVHYRDISELRRLQEGLAQADKLAALGKLAGGVAHEINSPLAGILAFAQMVLREMDETNPHRTDLLEIEDAARKTKVIVEGLLNFARQDKPSENAAVDVAEVAASALRLASPTLRKNSIVALMEFPSEKLLVFGSAGKLGQIILNLLTNAAYAMREDGGELTISASLEEDNVLIAVRDTGVGIEPHNLKRIFDPFFTTKPIGEGTGLGLSISYSIAKQHGGEIRVASVPGMGSTFTLVLPLMSANN